MSYFLDSHSTLRRLLHLQCIYKNQRNNSKKSATLWIPANKSRHIFKLQIQQIQWQVINMLIPYILESNPHPNLIRTSLCRFLKWKKS